MIKMFNIETEMNGTHNITEQVMSVLAESGVTEGILVVEVPHSTAGLVATSHFDPLVKTDVMNEIKRLIPSRINFLHQETPDDAAGHVKCGLYGTSITSIIHEGKLVNDNVLHYFFMEYDGPRTRKYFVRVMADR